MKKARLRPAVLVALSALAVLAGAVSLLADGASRPAARGPASVPGRLTASAVKPRARGPEAWPETARPSSRATASAPARPAGRGVPAAPARSERPSAASRSGRSVAPVATAALVAKLEVALHSKDKAERLKAARSARELHARELDPDLRRALAKESDPGVRRVVAQALALSPGVKTPEDQQALRALFSDPDLATRVNAHVGVARSGDEAAQCWLLELHDAAAKKQPRLAAALEPALAAPELCSPALLARFASYAQDAQLDPAVRARAAQALQAKRQSFHAQVAAR